MDEWPNGRNAAKIDRCGGRKINGISSAWTTKQEGISRYFGNLLDIPLKSSRMKTSFAVNRSLICSPLLGTRPLHANNHD